METKTELIFKNKCPLKNKNQGDYPKLLFVCTAGLLRGPTAATVAAKYGYNARSCGANPSYALIPISVNLIQWADKVIFLDLAAQTSTMVSYLKEKTILWDVPDIHDYMSSELVAELEGNFAKYKDVINGNSGST